MSEVISAMFDTGIPLLYAFVLGVMFGNRVIRRIIVNRILQEENILDGGRSEDSRHTTSVK